MSFGTDESVLFCCCVTMVINHIHRTREGLVTCVSFQIAMVSLSHGRLEDKQRSKKTHTHTYM